MISSSLLQRPQWCLTGLSCGSVEGDAGWALCVINWKDKNGTYQTQRLLMKRGQPWQGTVLSFCSEAKTSQPSSHCDVRHPHGARSATEREFAQPEIGLASLSVLSQYELHSLWYPSADVALVSSCHKNFKCPSGMWQKVTSELYAIALVGLMRKHLAWHLERSNKPNIQRFMSGKLLLLPELSTC